jgi:N-acyl-D-aspartate/D-glutamate deacylase
MRLRDPLGDDRIRCIIQLMMIIRGAKVVDGTGRPARHADVVVDGARIVDVTEPDADTGGDQDDVIDLDGLVLAPGFIDCHTHYDAQVLWDQDLTPSCWHGVTTVVMGNCGFGIAPTRPEQRETIARTLENVEGMSVEALTTGIPWTFETFPEYLDAIEEAGVRLNTAVMIGHTPLRLYVMGDDATERAATDDEVAAMRRLVGEALDAGAVGFATSRSPAHAGAYGKPVPSRLAELPELFAIADVLRERGKGVVAATFGPDLYVEELAELSKRIRRPVTWTALTASGRTPNAKATLERQATLGGEVWPQVACRPIVMQLTLSDPFPFARAAAFAEMLGQPHEERASLYRDEAWRERARADMATTLGTGWDRISIQETVHHADLRGVSMADLATARGVEPLDVMVDLALADDLTTRFRFVVANDDEEDLAAVLTDDRSLLGLSDAGAHASQLCDAVFSTYLLQHWVRETGALSLEKAVWRLTDHPARVFRLPDRGRIARGFAADLVAFDPAAIAVGEVERVHDLPAGADRLVAKSRGIQAVWVNGESIVRDGVDVANRPGVLIRDGGGD